jgi:hypothetical protein
MEVFSQPNKNYFNLDETSDEVCDILQELEIIMGNTGSSNNVIKTNIMESNSFDENTLPIFNEMETSSFFCSSFNNFETFDSNSIIHPNPLEINEESLKSTNCSSILSDIDSDTALINKCFKKNILKTKSKVFKKENSKEHSRRYREKEKKMQEKLEKDLIQKSELNNRLAKKVELLNNIIEILNCICYFKTSYGKHI